MSYKNPANSNFRNNTGDTTYKSGNTIDVNSKQATPIVYPTLHPENFAGVTPVLLDKNITLDEAINSGSIGKTSGYAKDTDLIDGTINAKFDTLTANEYHITILSSSVMYANGSNKFGDSVDDRHEFTGSILIGGDVLGNARLNQATASLQFNSASVDAQLARVYQATASLNTFTASQDSRNLTLSTVTGSLIGITNGLMALTASMKNSTIVSSSTQIQNYNLFALNSNLYNSTGSIQSEINGLMAVTASMKAASIFSGSIQIGLTLSNYANDGAAASGGVPIGGLYHTSGTVKVRLT